MIELPVGRTPPNGERAFIHKKILGGVSKLAGIGAAIGIPGAGTISAVTRFIGGRGGGFVPRTELPRGITQTSIGEKERGSRAKGLVGGEVQAFTPSPFFRGGDGGGSPCPTGMRRDFQSGQCEAAAGQAVGEAIMGRYGAGLLPGSIIIDRAVCLKGMQLGDDGVCYNKSQITNKQRAWPAGRKPLLSGGDMRAISIAARAGRRLEGATKRLQRLGMMKKPTSSRRLSRAPHPALLVESSVKH